ncbi:hypothetical protein LTR56_000851 [Elasticomyces elasticus]|nr:hypothetical protein LTR22_018622 [Elasticomyces elasticus]KAK3660475.1 hypothetical protein LTR56_000851 [Elasticomyces elasticus]KAK4912277.1 hypothetical protein LTR49_019278 [Elasticomyces elasticus]KAK5751789.1 hypothetical protein LTS12_018117 [Elasticomyces elasticus]
MVNTTGHRIMRTRQSTRTAGEGISDDAYEVVAHARAKVFAARRTTRETKYAATPCKFNIFDLVPELRERIYFYALETNKLRSLHDLRTPTLAAVSKQVRAEVLPIFFTKCQFRADIRSNHQDMAALDGQDLPPRSKLSKMILRGPFDVHLDPLYRLDLEYRESGLIVGTRGRSLSRASVLNLQKREGYVATFRNVSFRISRRSVNRAWERGMASVMDVRIATASRLRPVITFTNPEAGEVSESSDLGVVRARAKAKVDEIVLSRERFVGFTLQDLEAVARQFRYWPGQEE